MQKAISFVRIYLTPTFKDETPTNSVTLFARLKALQNKCARKEEKFQKVPYLLPSPRIHHYDLARFNSPLLTPPLMPITQTSLIRN